MSHPTRKYAVRTTAFMAGYVAVNVAAMTGALDDAAGTGGYALAVAAAAPVIAQIGATLAYMREADEYLSQRLAKRFIVAAGLAIALFTAWGFAESFAGAPHAPGWLVYPLFWAIFAVVSPFVTRTG